MVKEIIDRMPEGLSLIKNCTMHFRHFCNWLLLLAVLPAAAQERSGSWPYYGQNAGGTRYAAPDQINVRNVAQLKPVWTYRTGELRKYEGNYAREKAACETTPILIGRTLYLSTPSDRVIA